MIQLSPSISSLSFKTNIKQSDLVSLPEITSIIHPQNSFIRMNHIDMNSQEIDRNPSVSVQDAELLLSFSSNAQKPRKLHPKFRPYVSEATHIPLPSFNNLTLSNNPETIPRKGSISSTSDESLSDIYHLHHVHLHAHHQMMIVNYLHIHQLQRHVHLRH